MRKRREEKRRNRKKTTKYPIQIIYRNKMIEQKKGTRAQESEKL